MKKEIIQREDLKTGPKILFDDIIHLESRSVEIKKIFFNEKEKVRISAVEKNRRLFDFYLLTEDDYHRYLKKHYFRKEFYKKRNENFLMEVMIPKQALWYFVIDCSTKKLERDVHLTIYQE